MAGSQARPSNTMLSYRLAPSAVRCARCGSLQQAPCRLPRRMADHRRRTKPDDVGKRRPEADGTSFRDSCSRPNDEARAWASAHAADPTGRTGRPAQQATAMPVASASLPGGCAGLQAGFGPSFRCAEDSAVKGRATLAYGREKAFALRPATAAERKKAARRPLFSAVRREDNPGRQAADDAPGRNPSRSGAPCAARD